MAKSDAFFIRAKLDQSGATFVDQEIDLGSFVNLGVSKSTILRIHAIEVQIADKDAPEKGPFTSGATMNIGWDLTTQQQSTLVHLNDNKDYDVQYNRGTLYYCSTVINNTCI